MANENEPATHNGWTNYETWNVNLWMDNDENGQRYYADLAQTAYDDAFASEYATRMQNAKYNLAQTLKDEYEENTPTVTGVYADLLNAALSQVNWYEIAENLLSEIETDD